MSAFAGLLAIGRALPVDLAERFAKALDAPGLELPQHWSEAGVHLSHRMRVTAPEDRQDKQPRRHAEHPLVLVFDGYLVNRPELIQSLTLPASAKTWPDSALAFEALIRWDERAAEHLLGDFALAAWNPSTQCLLLARDGVGQRPLYYHYSNGLFAFATSPTALLAIPGIPWGVDEDRLILNLFDLPLDPHSTFHKHISALPAGSVATLRGGRLTQRCYWTPERKSELHLPHEEDYVEAARELFDRAVRDCLRIEGPAFSSITGGLDSSAVSVTALRNLPGNRLTTLTSLPAEGTITADSPSFYASERPYVESIAERNPGLIPLFFPGPELHSWDTDWTAMFQSTGTPWRNVMNLAWMGPARDYVRQQGGRVLLSGGLGNITLSWDGQGTLPGLIRRGRWLQALREASALAQSSGRSASTARQIFRTTLMPFLPGYIQRAMRNVLGQSAELEWQKQCSVTPAARTRPKIQAAFRKRERMSTLGSWELRQCCFEERQVSLEAMGLVRALHGFEVRDPMADRRLLEFCFSLPDSFYLKGGVSRLLARHVTADRLPASVVNNRRRGLQCPEYIHRMTSMRPMLAEHLAQLNASPLAREILDLKRMSALLAHWPSTPWHREYLTVLHRGLHFGQFLHWVESGGTRN